MAFRLGNTIGISLKLGEKNPYYIVNNFINHILNSPYWFLSKPISFLSAGVKYINGVDNFLSKRMFLSHFHKKNWKNAV
jgi:hypothetical protein